MRELVHQITSFLHTRAFKFQCDKYLPVFDEISIYVSAYSSYRTLITSDDEVLDGRVCMESLSVHPYSDGLSSGHYSPEGVPRKEGHPGDVGDDRSFSVDLKVIMAEPSKKSMAGFLGIKQIDFHQTLPMSAQIQLLIVMHDRKLHDRGQVQCHFHAVTLQK